MILDPLNSKSATKLTNKSPSKNQSVTTGASTNHTPNNNNNNNNTTKKSQNKYEALYELSKRSPMNHRQDKSTNDIEFEKYRNECTFVPNRNLTSTY